MPHQTIKTPKIIIVNCEFQPDTQVGTQMSSQKNKEKNTCKKKKVIEMMRPALADKKEAVN